jgi:hypothetical protein
MATRATILLPLLLLAACQAPESLSNNGASSTPVSGTAPAGGSSEPAAPVQTATLTGLYESGAAPRRSQMCVTERAGASARFGIVHWSGASESCSGSGTAARSGNVLRLTMEGDEACTIDARIDGTRVSFPANLPAGCAYYCSRGGRLAGATFDKTGGAEADALRAEDLVGDRLCGA